MCFGVVRIVVYSCVFCYIVLICVGLDVVFMCNLIQFWCCFDLCWSLCCAYLCFDSVLVLLWQIQIDLGPGDTSTVLNFSSTVFHYSFTFHLFSYYVSSKTKRC